MEKINQDQINILLVEDNPGDARLIDIYLSAMDSFSYRLTKVINLSQALEFLSASGENIELILLDLSLPDSSGLNTLLSIQPECTASTIVILTGLDDEIVAINALKEGAQDYLVKNSIDSALLARTIRHSIERKNFFNEIYKKSVTDEITGLPNRIKLKNDLEIADCSGLVILNINNFSTINGAFGRDAGNVVLKQIVLEVQKMLPAHVALYRLESDEFVLFFKDGSQDMIAIVNNINHQINSGPIVYEGIELNISFCAGIVGGEKEDLFNKANLALLEAQKRGKGIAVEYVDSLSERTDFRHNIKMIKKVKAALQNDNIVPYFQGIRDNATGKIRKFECLARLRENGNVLSPHSFLPAAQQAGFLTNITRRMVESSFAYFADKDADFSINLTFDDIINPEFLVLIKANLKKYKLEPGRVIFEVLENISVSDDQKVINKLKMLKVIGCKISIDDFGTEYSNFASLHNIQADYIKIDGRFIKNLDTNDQSMWITESITEFAHKIGAQVVAEFVHSESVQKKVEEIGIDYSQGFYFSEPSPDIREFIEA